MAERTLGFDVSFYQDSNYTPQKIDFQKMKDYGAWFVIMRTGQGNWIDEDWSDYAKDSYKVDDLYRGSYWFYDARWTIKSQCKLYWDTIKPMGMDFRPVMDWEAWSINSVPQERWSRGYFLSLIAEFLERMDNYYGNLSMFYTNPRWLKYLSPLPDWLLKHPLWLAAYNSVPPTYLYGYDKWHIWQDGTPAIGLAAGVESKEIDRDWFNGSVEELEKWLGIVHEPAPVPPPLPVEIRLDKIENRLGILENKIEQM